MEIWKQVLFGYKDLWQAIIQPRRYDYSMYMLGRKEFQAYDLIITRNDFVIRNNRQQKLQCSFYEPTDDWRPARKLPCVIYLHGSGWSRVEGVPAVHLLTQYGIWVLLMDLSGSGKSEGEYISCGWYECEDLKAAIDYLSGLDRVSSIGVWGRSMGAVTALIHGSRDSRVSAIVVDSAFSDLPTLCKETAQTRSKAPGMVLNSLLAMVRRSILSRAKFDINDVRPIDYARKCKIPAMFAYATKDYFVRSTHTNKLFGAYLGEKWMYEFAGDHASPRTLEFHDVVSDFFISHLLYSVENLQEMSKEEQIWIEMCLSRQKCNL